MSKPVTMIVVVFLFLVAILHLLRLLFQVEVTAGGIEIPQWVSIFGTLIPAGLATMLWSENKKTTSV